MFAAGVVTLAMAFAIEADRLPSLDLFGAAASAESGVGQGRAARRG